jgi:hypothetical protein
MFTSFHRRSKLDKRADRLQQNAFCVKTLRKS